MDKIIIGVMVFLFGTILGSFYNAVIYRIPLDMTISKGRSICPSCKHQLSALDLVPFFSWLFLGRKCRYCKEPISWRYPLIELFTGIIFLITYIHFGFNWQLLIYVSFFSMLIVTFFIDLDAMIVSLPVLIIGSVISLIGIILYNLNYVTAEKTSTLVINSLVNSFKGAVVGFLIYFAIYFFAKLFYKKEAFGFGDVLLLTAIGIVLGPAKTAVVGFLSPFIAIPVIIILSIIGKKVELKKEIPYGPYMCVAAFIVALYGTDLINFYLNITGIAGR